MIQSIFFILITAFIASKAISKYKSIYRNINLGKDEQIIASPNRLRNMIYFALGQKKMFDRPIVGIFHLFIYTAFIITQIELIEVFVDGISGNHRIFASLLGGFYTLIINSIEVLSLLALVATFIFLYRRNILKLIRFQNQK